MQYTSQGTPYIEIAGKRFYLTEHGAPALKSYLESIGAKGQTFRQMLSSIERIQP